MISIDLATLMIAGSFVAAVSGVFLVFAWMQNRKATATLWWAASNIVLAMSIPMMASPRPQLGTPAVVAAITLLNLSPALLWASARSCNGRRINPFIIASGPVLWLTAFFFPAIRESTSLQVSLNLAIVAAFLLAAAFEFWRDRHERLTARWPLIVLLALHGGLSAIGSVEAAYGGLAASSPATFFLWLEFVHFETLAFVIGTSIFTVAMARERSELLHKIAANTDALTDVATRRAFYDAADEMLTFSLERDASLAVIVFDLDGFKSINDTFGHAMGDEVLKTFGAVAMRTLRSTDLIGRLGGEEFAALLPGASVGSAFVAAERIRTAFTEACLGMKNLKTTATVSAGIARANPKSTVDSMLGEADAALYEAKRHGRDRVEVADRLIIGSTKPEEAAATALARQVA